ncbi:acyltransferase [Hymenobacter sp. DG01]|uniref:acyltransferase family protein n=1 Tax=Hymenobacter sp. DG01 TaxID=2584940 RepID=UPI0015DFA40F|nr:acyltransferase family protein [Hymenobacter sp. DG01]
MPQLFAKPVDFPSAVQRRFDFNLEALRGLAALVVVWHHVIVHSRQLDPNYAPTGIGAYNAPGHFAVLIFFLLSGFVIGRRYPEPMQRSEVRSYVRKRFERLYPMYVVALFAGVAASGFTVGWASIGQHLLFLQGWWSPVLVENNPLWSLQYEIIFYLAFIPLSLIRARPWLITLLATLVGIGLLLSGYGGFALRWSS